MIVATTRDELHRLVDALPDEDLADAGRYLASLQSGADDMLTWVLDNAPVDDEPTTPEEEALVEEARQEVRCGETISAEEAKRLLGGCAGNDTIPFPYSP